ncbi:MAG: cysteine synthase family protein [Acidobacteria bacterium]|nr:cysteine synthase family protein [Acidobacteriota bacterium]
MALAAPRLYPYADTTVLAQIGNTPLLHLRKLTANLPGVEIYAKAESFNPGGSVKDRPALNMILDGERTGKLNHQRVILDATSGNTGIAYAMIGAARGYKVKLCLPSNASPERRQILRAYGASLILTDPGQGTDGAIRRCREIYESDPDHYFYPDQYSNPANWKAHFESTAVEIMEQTGRRLTHFVAGLGTSGTFVGVTRRLRRDLPHVKCYSMQPATPFHGLEGLKHMATAMVPAIYDPSIAEGNFEVETEQAYHMVKRLAREEGILAGISAGANLAASLALGERLAAAGEPALIVTVICDGAEKYLSEEFWNDPD